MMSSFDDDSTRLLVTLLMASVATGCSETNETPEISVASNRMVGTSENDVLTGTDASDYLEGRERIDILEAKAGDDVLNGGPGGDTLVGGLGDDTYLYSVGDGGDVIQDAGGQDDVVVFGGGISASDLRITEDPGVLRITIGNMEGGGVILVDGWETSEGRLERLQFDGGSELRLEDIESAIKGNRRPKLNVPLPDQHAQPNQPFRLDIPEGAFEDPEGDVVTLSAMIEGGKPFSETWLTFDQNDQVFSGTPSSDDVASLVIVVRGFDSTMRYAETRFEISVSPE